eukprot:581464-Amphidinium_carterae.1
MNTTVWCVLEPGPVKTPGDMNIVSISRERSTFLRENVHTVQGSTVFICGRTVRRLIMMGLSFDKVKVGR